MRRADNVPRSRSDVDMDAAAEATRLHQSASSSASSLSARWAPVGVAGRGSAAGAGLTLPSPLLSSPQVTGKPHTPLHSQDGAQVSCLPGRGGDGREAACCLPVIWLGRGGESWLPPP